MIQEIHFYTDLSNEEQVSDWDLETMLTDFISTRNAIKDNYHKIIKTTQLSFLRDCWDYIASGIKVFIHYNDGRVLEIKEHSDDTIKDLKVGQDVSRLLIGGAFGELI